MRINSMMAGAITLAMACAACAQDSASAAQPSASAGTTFAASAAMGRARPALVYAFAPSCRPIYPPAAVRAHAEGDTRVRFSIDATGKILSAKTVRSSGPTPEHHLLDQAAVETLSRCPITPGVGASGEAVASQVELTYRWILR